MTALYNRVLLKLSGEVLNGGKTEKTFCWDFIKKFVSEVIVISNSGVEIGIVVGSGNIWRGAENLEIEQTTSHQIGMLATVMNALVLREVFEELGAKSVVVSNLSLPQIIDNIEHKQVISRLQNGEIVIFGGGTGQPYFTTDTGAALWALKIDADVILKATKVDGVYSSDPMNNPNAKKYNEISLTEAFKKELKVMDSTAFSLCMKHKIPVVVYKLIPGNTKKAIFEKNVGTLVYHSKK